jgi:hypothetical protein
MKRTVFALGVLFAACPALAQTWDETIDGGGDAGDLLATAQVCDGSGTLSAIAGSNGANDVDMYQIQITDEANFSASTVGNVTWDTQLFLFDSTGRGVTFDDDDPAGSGLQSVLSSAFVNANGLYYLAISRYNRDAVATGGLIWINTPWDAERAPDGPGAANPVTSWTGTIAAGGAYTIALTGVSFVGGAECPGDFDNSGERDLQDLAILLSAFGNSAGGDMDGDGDTDLQDLAFLLAVFGASCP